MLLLLLLCLTRCWPVHEECFRVLIVFCSLLRFVFTFVNVNWTVWKKLFGKCVYFAVQWISKAKLNKFSVWNWHFSNHSGTVHINSSFSHMFRFCFFPHIISKLCALHWTTTQKVPSLQKKKKKPEQRHGLCFSVLFNHCFTAMICPLQTVFKSSKTHAIKQQKRNNTNEPFGKWSFFNGQFVFPLPFRFAYRDESMQTLYHIWSSYRIMNGLNLNGQWTTEYHIHLTLQFAAIRS